MFGTKRPSITSTWIQSVPAVSTARTSSPNRAKSADRTEGAMMIDGMLARALTRSASSMEALADLIARALLCDWAPVPCRPPLDRQTNTAGQLVERVPPALDYCQRGSG